MPNLALGLQQSNAQGNRMHFNLQVRLLYCIILLSSLSLKGMMAGNPWTDPAADNEGAAYQW